MKPRQFLDITTLLNYSGRADGISRTIRNLASYAASNRGDIEFVYLGGAAPMLVNRSLLPLVKEQAFKVDTSYFTDPFAKPRFRERLPPPLKRLLLWIQRPRRQALLFLERLYLTGSRFSALAERLKPLLLNDRYRRFLTGADGQFMHLVPHDIAFSDLPALKREDVLIFAGADWVSSNRYLKGIAEPPRIVVLWYDIIPLLFPEMFSESLVDAFRDYFHEIVPRTQLLIFNARQIQKDAETYCAENGITFGRSGIVHLGSDPLASRPTKTIALPAGLTSGSFALFVSTIEPRKGHRLLFDVWKTLLAEGVPQTSDFKLVFVGRKGWMVNQLVKDIEAHPSFGKSLFWLSDADDATLFALYEECAFTLYPSLYEGFGLPIIESFAHHKAVLASSAGALAETVANFSPCLSPHDESAWVDALRQWIAEPSRFKTFEDQIRLHYRPKSWESAAEDFFKLIDRSLLLSADGEVSEVRVPV